jgi:glycosyltransferase involved in cell wall biosynthesis
MSKILLVGDVPPPMCIGEKIEASNYRTWQFLLPLMQDQNKVHLCASPNCGIEAICTPDDWKDFLTFHHVQFGERGWRKQLQAIHDQLQPDCIVAVNYQPNLHTSRLETDAPIWMDLYGDQLTIMQLTFYRHSNNRGLHTTIGHMNDILQKGDIFSGCGIPQQHLTVGELAMTGRLNSRTMGYEFTRVILPGAPPAVRNPDRNRERPLLKQQGIGEDDFVVLWCGGYNAWTDIEVLFAGLEKAMAENDRIHYVSIGESTYPSPDNMYNQFKKLIAGSVHADRYHLLGWMPWASIADYYFESNVGVNIDGLHYETIYGTRTRLLEMMATSLPIVTSEGTELSYLLRDKGVALTFGSGEWEQFGANIIQLSLDQERYQAMRECVYQAARGEFSFYETTAALREWVKQPQRAPDRAKLTSHEQNQEIKNRGRAALRRLAWRLFDQE